MQATTLFLLGLVLASSGFLPPPVSLAAGILFALLIGQPLRTESARAAKQLLQLSVIALGFGMNLAEVLKAGSSGFRYTALSITGSMSAGLILGRFFRVSQRASILVTVGTAICGGSAIAAVAPILDASEEEISVGMGTVFLLNSIALFLFPP